ncbi:OmpH family outer membrane protein [Thalassobellus sediminis]|uniref:OmpH family outer membrane protein n=1 Tax=Thalassobellus sediminis TaxID=3367753 RepID=UPI003790BB19
MKKIIYVALAMLVLASCQKSNKIGFVDNGTIINDYQEKIDLEARFKIKQEAYSKKFDSIDQAFQLEVQKFQTDAKRMAQAKAQQKYQELGQKKQVLDQQRQIEAQQFQQSFQAELDSIIVKVKDFVKDYGKTNGYTYILGTSDAAATVMYGADENDLTKAVLDALNAEAKKED